MLHKIVLRCTKDIFVYKLSYKMVISISILLLLFFSSCIGIIAFRALDSEKYAHLRESIKFYNLPNPVKEAAMVENPPSDSLFYINDDLTIDQIHIKRVNRSIDGPNHNNISLLKAGNHFKIEEKKFFVGSSADPKIYYNGYFYYTRDFGITTKPKNLEEVSQRTYRTEADLLDSVVFYKVDLSKWLD